MLFLGKIFNIISIMWYLTVFYYYIYEYCGYSKKITKLEDNFQCQYSSSIINNKFDLIDNEQYYFQQNARIPINDRLYLLSYAKNHIFSLVYMNTPSEVKYFIFINYDKNKNIFCKKISNISSEIIRSLSETNNRYYAVKNYGNTYFIDPTFELIKILSIELPSCNI